MKSYFKLVFEILAENRKIFNRIAKREYWSNYDVLYINGFVSTSSKNLWETFFKFRIRFRFFGRKSNYFQKNWEAWILIKLQCVIYQWIRLNELYKLMNFFQISNYLPKTEKYSTNRKGWVYASEVGKAFVLISTRSSLFALNIFQLHVCFLANLHILSF